MYTVLVADDEEELRRALIRKVDWSGAGFQVIGEAENGAEALEMVERLEPDLLLTDIRMPYISGIELAREIREVRPTTQIVFLSGYDDFSYAQQAIQYNIISYLLKPISSAEMFAELQSIRQKIDEKFEQFADPGLPERRAEVTEFLMPLVLDSYRRASDAEKQKKVEQEAIRYGLINENCSHFQYVIMKVTLYDEKGENRTGQATVNAIDMILRKYVRHSSFLADGKVISLLIGSAASLDRFLHIIVEDIVQSVDRILHLSCDIGVGRSVDHLADIHNSYAEAMSTTGYSGKRNENICFFSDMERLEGIDVEMVQSSISAMEHKIRSGTEQETTEYVEELCARITPEKFPPVHVNFFYSQLTSSILRMIYAVVDNEAVHRLQNEVGLQLSTYRNDREFVRNYTDFCLKARNLILEQRKKSSQVICDKALKLIEEKYMDPVISLVSVSGEIGVSPNYLSGLIKKYTGSTFVDFLTKKRVEKARELLLGSSMKIKEISEVCGYNDQHYFSYSFKKYTGMTPNACRRSINYEEQKES